MYMGGPDSISAIEPFLKNLFSDREIIDFKVGNKLQNFIAGKIAKKRSLKVAADYEKIGGASPQIKHLDDLLSKVRSLYQSSYDKELITEIGMCYYHPFIEDTICKLQDHQYDNIFVMTMYPQYSYTTSGVCFSRFNNALKMSPASSVYKMIPYWHLNNEYLNCIKKQIINAADKLSKKVDDCLILYSAHSLPEYTIEKGDVYISHIEEQINWLAKQFPSTDYLLSFQSRTGPMKWIGPETSDELNRLSDESKTNIIVVPISFVSDHVETLIELDEMYIKSVRDKGMNIVRVDSLNSCDDFANAIISIIKE